MKVVSSPRWSRSEVGTRDKRGVIRVSAARQLRTVASHIQMSSRLAKKNNANDAKMVVPIRAHSSSRVSITEWQHNRKKKKKKKRAIDWWNNLTGNRSDLRRTEWYSRMLMSRAW
jgi:hypothetical protein